MLPSKEGQLKQSKPQGDVNNALFISIFVKQLIIRLYFKYSISLDYALMLEPNGSGMKCSGVRAASLSTVSNPYAG